MKITTYIVDSFTRERFKGNPAGVCLVDIDLKEQVMLSIAKELGLSETAFVKRTGIEGKFNIRFFSPKMEIPLCGHATLASSKVLFSRESGLNSIHFTNIQNIELTISKIGDDIIMEFPIYNTVPSTVPEALLKALGVETIRNCVYNKETNILVLEIKDSRTLSDLKPDFEALIASHHSINGVLVTAPSDKENYDFESRYFWPWSGTNEDPVTGGTHTFLAGYWGQKLGKTKMNSFQCSERTGYMTVELIDDHKMTIRSQAQIMLEGTMEV